MYIYAYVYIHIYDCIYMYLEPLLEPPGGGRQPFRRALACGEPYEAVDVVWVLLEDGRVGWHRLLKAALLLPESCEVVGHGDGVHRGDGCGVLIKRSTGRTHTHRQNNTPDTDTHTHRQRTTPPTPTPTHTTRTTPPTPTPTNTTRTTPLPPTPTHTTRTTPQTPKRTPP